MPLRSHSSSTSVESTLFLPQQKGAAFASGWPNDKSLVRNTSKFGKSGVWAQESSAYALSRATLSETGELVELATYSVYVS